MTRCVIDSDGLFVEEQYFDDGRQSIETELPTLKRISSSEMDGREMGDYSRLSRRLGIYQRW